MKIDIKLVDLKYEKITQSDKSFLEFHENGIHYCRRYYSDVPKSMDDEGLGWENTFRHHERFALKQFIVGYEKMWVSTSKCWEITIAISGFVEDIRIYLKRESEATELMEKIHNYLHGA